MVTVAGMTGGLVIKLSETLLKTCGCYAVLYLSKPLECATPQVKPNVNYRVWATTVCQCRFVDNNKRTTPGHGADSGPGCTSIEAGGRWGREFFLLSPQFCCESKRL